MSEANERKLARDLLLARQFEILEDYPRRNSLILRAIIDAQALGLECGLGVDRQEDPEFEGYRVVAYIELPTGQVSWHLKEHEKAWDGHPTGEKWARVNEFALSTGVSALPGAP